MDEQTTGGTSVAEPTTTPEPQTPDTSTTEGVQTETNGSAPGVVQKGGLSVTIPKPKSRFRERIDKMHGEREQTEAENRDLRARIAELEGRGQNGTRLAPRGTPGAEPKADAPLKAEDFDTYEDYIDAVMTRKLEQAQKKQQTQAGEDAVLQHRSERMQAFQEAAAPLIQQHGEAFMEAISDPSLPVTGVMADAVLELEEIGPFVMLYLAANPTECLKIAKMNPRSATVAIGRLASRLEYEIRQGGEGNPPAAESMPGGANTPAPSGGAPIQARPAPSAVPTPRGGSPAQLDQTPSDKMDTRTWMLAEAERLRKKYGPNVRTWVPK